MMNFWSRHLELALSLSSSTLPRRPLVPPVLLHEGDFLNERMKLDQQEMDLVAQVFGKLLHLPSLQHHIVSFPVFLKHLLRPLKFCESTISSNGSACIQCPEKRLKGAVASSSCDDPGKI
ncbi:uncharacterized protein LOC121764301 [Salvia splendens]|uniref:uncharacterized protein LOC121764301 n=1 Tax=Salvia splendens TaxID=180675 RepID=UPI001C2736A5|nr:uncharacterized protein LOC121764301 [Salvia splendens]